MVVQSWHEPANGYFIFQQNPENGEAIYEAQEVRCSVCYSVSKDLAVLFRPQPEDVTEELIIKWIVRLNDLADSAENGCQFCGFMATRFFHDPAYIFFLSKDSQKPVTGCCGASSKSELTEDVQRAITHLRERHAEHPDKEMTLVCQKFQSDKHGIIPGKVRWTAAFTDFPFEAVQKILGLRTELVIELYALKDDPTAEWVRVRPVNIDPTSEGSLSWAKSRLDECLNRHSGCPGPSTTQLPKRVIQIIDQDNLKITAGEEIGSYTALSYCWGGPQIFGTSTDTFAKMSEGFKTSELPQTLQDAVHLTSKLGIEYLWVDSLCIIQDSAEDKEQEIAKMSQYYQDAYVTISAGGEKATDGFFKPHDFCEIHPHTGLGRDLLSMPFLCPNNEVGKVYFREEKNYCLCDEHISKRAWTLQERMLSSRVLIYGSRVLWQCNTTQQSDGGCEDWSFDLRSSKQRLVKLDLAGINRTTQSDLEDITNNLQVETISADDSAAIENSPNQPTAKQPFDVSGIWYSAVHEYSFRQLTIPSDKLPAISGIAIALSKISNDEYLAGLWRSNLLRELMWSTHPDIKTLPSAIWRAPSWSWASLNNCITFERLPSLSAIPLATIISCTVVPRNPASEFGEVTSANLRIRGPMVEINDIDAVENLLKKENQPIGPRDEDKGLAFRTQVLHFIAYDKPGMGDNEDWVKPENVALLVLFGEGEIEENGIKESNEEITDEIVERKNNEAENSMGEKINFRFKDDKAVVSCLVLTRKEDGMYERVGSLSMLTMKGMENVMKMMRDVEIV